MRQYRGCSRLYYAIYTYDEKTGVTFGDVKKLCEVKAISREISSENEEIWADNKLQDTMYGGTSVTRTFTCMRVDPAIAAELLGESIVTVGDTIKMYGTAPDGSKRPYVAIGYALHDGKVNEPCEVVWGYKGIVNSISQTANTIDRGTASEGQEVNVTFSAPDAAWNKTGNNELDLAMPINDANKALVEKWFAKVITPDNAETELKTTA